MTFRRAFLPLGISLYITYRCHLRCGHCFLVQNGLLNKFELSLSKIKEIIDDAQANRVFLLILSGGEPLIHPDFPEIVRYARDRKMLPLIAITGIRIENAHIRVLKENSIPTVQVSVDSARPGIHDLVRGPGTHVETLNNIVRLIGAGLLVNVAICLHKSNKDELAIFLTKMRELGVSRIKLDFYREYGGAHGFTPLGSSEIQAALNTAKHFLLKYAQPDWIACPNYEIESGKELKRTRRHAPLVVGADGHISAGEGGETIGHVDAGTISSQYTRYVEMSIEKRLNAIVNALASENGVECVGLLPASAHPDGVVLKYKEKIEVLVKEGLPPPWRYFTILHELGHVATGTLYADAKSSTPAHEEAANLWALNALKPHIESAAFKKYIEVATIAAQDLRSLVVENLFNDIVRYR